MHLLRLGCLGGVLNVVSCGSDRAADAPADGSVPTDNETDGVAGDRSTQSCDAGAACTDANAPDSALPMAVTRVAGHLHQTCALTTAGGLKCWGRGYPGDGTNMKPLTPADSTGFTSGLAAVACGLVHTCVLTSSGKVACWGNNASGQIGDGTSQNDRLTPVEVPGLTSVVAIAAGAAHTCALMSTGRVTCWGDNNAGQIGAGTAAEQHSPMEVSGLAESAVAIAAGQQHTCAAISKGGVKCWGSNGSGQIGDGTSGASRPMPTDVLSLAGTRIKALSGTLGYSCALTSAGAVKCWGSAYLGDGTRQQSLTPVDVVGLTSGVTAIAGSGDHTCALLSNGGIKCWGSNTYGDVGDGTNAMERRAPVDVSGLTAGVMAIGVGTFHTCALTFSGAVKCWGFNADGQVEPADAGQNRPLPVDVTGF